ncbi:hypothetical protein ACIBKX_40360 [Streptomyces sp. NPDC050658]|uniref:hypothetical protein n=1 Tax=unclassified Streptomyces TaxID=2593676 RepID=UPI00341CBC7F
MFRRNRTTAPTPSAPEQPEAEVIAINLDELAALERVLLEAERLLRLWRDSLPYYGPGLITVNDVTAMLYQRAGAASVVQPDRQRARIPLYRHEFKWLATAIAAMERHWTRAEHLSEARNLYNRFNALLGASRATTYMGGTAVLTPESPQDPGMRVIPSREP